MANRTRLLTYVAALALAAAAWSGCMAKYGNAELRVAPLGSWSWDYPGAYTHQVIVSNAPGVP